MKVITVTNRKGGVGKSTMAVHIAAGLAARGSNVGLVDTDSQGHAARMLGLAEENGLFNALIEKQPLEEIVRVIPPERYSTPDHPSLGNLYLIPSSEKTYKIPFELGAHESLLFFQKMEEFRQLANLDVIIIDTNPTMSQFDGAVYLATDGFVYVTECEALAFDGVTKAIAQMQQFSETRKQFLKRESRIIGIIPNKLYPNTLIHRQNIQELAQHFGRFDKGGLVMKPINRRTAWVESSQFGELVYVWKPTGEEVEDALRVTKEIEEYIKAWEMTSAGTE